MKTNSVSFSALLVHFVTARMATYYSPLKFKKIKDPIPHPIYEKKTC